MTIRLRDNLVYGGIVLFSVVFLIWVIPAYTPAYPGYGIRASLVPNVVVGIILVISALALVRDLLAYLAKKPISPGKGEIPAEDKVHLWHLAKFMIPCLLLMPAMKWVGFIQAGAVFMLVIQYICGQRKPVPLVLVTVGTVGILYAVMRYALSVPMP